MDEMIIIYVESNYCCSINTSLQSRIKDLEKEATPTASVAMNEGCFALIIVASSYVNLR